MKPLTIYFQKWNIINPGRRVKADRKGGPAGSLDKLRGHQVTWSHEAVARFLEKSFAASILVTSNGLRRLKRTLNK